MTGKLGRNDPCHCGSGKKYKQCHQRLDEEREKAERELKTIGQWVSFHTSRLIAQVPEAARPTGDDALLNELAVFDLPGGDADVHISGTAQPDDSAEVHALARALASSHLSLHECTECKRGRGVRLTDRLTGATQMVWDPELGASVDPMEVLLCRVIKVGDRAVVASGHEKVYFRGRKQAIADLAATIDAAAGEDAIARAGWLKRNGAAVIERARAARPSQ